tara:strand:- start:311 stop:502 length:192 start_codon:yes stop_codon:yes gene_type:complete
LIDSDQNWIAESEMAREGRAKKQHSGWRIAVCEALIIPQSAIRLSSGASRLCGKREIFSAIGV